MLDRLEFLASTLVKKKRETLIWAVPELIVKKWGGAVLDWVPQKQGKWLIWEVIPGNIGETVEMAVTGRKRTWVG